MSNRCMTCLFPLKDDELNECTECLRVEERFIRDSFFLVGKEGKQRNRDHDDYDDYEE